MRQRVAAVAAMALVLLASPVQAADLGARAMGMGGAYVALANDATAVYWNPAGLAEVSVVSVTPVAAVETSDWNDLQAFHELTGTASAVTVPTRDFSLSATGSGLLGIVTKRFGVTYAPRATVSAVYDYNFDSGSGSGLPLGTSLTASATTYNDTVVSLGLPLKKLPFKLAALNAGANLKFLKGKLYQTDRTLSSDDFLSPTELAEPLRMAQVGVASGFALDLGLQAELTKALRFGLVARDLARTENWTGTAPTGDTKPSVQAGVAVKAPLGLTVAADVESYSEGGEAQHRLRLGLEESLFGVLALRGGYRTNPGADPTYSVGVGAGLGKFLRLEVGAASDLKDEVQACLTAVAQF